MPLDLNPTPGAQWHSELCRREKVKAKVISDFFNDTAITAPHSYIFCGIPYLNYRLVLVKGFGEAMQYTIVEYTVGHITIQPLYLIKIKKRSFYNCKTLLSLIFWCISASSVISAKWVLDIWLFRSANNITNQMFKENLYLQNFNSTLTFIININILLLLRFNHYENYNLVTTPELILMSKLSINY